MLEKDKRGGNATEEYKPDPSLLARTLWKLDFDLVLHQTTGCSVTGGASNLAAQICDVFYCYQGHYMAIPWRLDTG